MLARIVSDELEFVHHDKIIIVNAMDSSCKRGFGVWRLGISYNLFLDLILLFI